MRATPCAKMQASSLIRSSRDMSVGSVWLVMRESIGKQENGLIGLRLQSDVESMSVYL
jgi:hypothetical protein